MWAHYNQSAVTQSSLWTLKGGEGTLNGGACGCAAASRPHPQVGLGTDIKPLLSDATTEKSNSPPKYRVIYAR
eukprot:7164533-Pyramimonas_sp.AAC.1